MKTDLERTIVEHGPSVGTHHAKPIPAYIITAAGQRSEFDRIAIEDADGQCDMAQLEWLESLIAPGLIYRSNVCDLVLPETTRNNLDTPNWDK